MGHASVDATAVVTDEAIALVARAYVVDRPALAREDCTGLVAAITGDAGHEVDGSVRDLWARAEAEGRLRSEPALGQIVFFDDTWDKDGDGEPNDPLTHAAVITDIEADGTIVMVHRGTTSGIAEIRMRPDRPSEHVVEGVVFNDYLARRGWADAEGGRLTGELLRGYATFADHRGSAPARERRGPRVPSTPVAAAPELEMVGLARIVDGRRLRWRDVNTLWCDDVPTLRDAVYARHGYVFEADARNAPFVGQSWYEPDATLGSTDAGQALSGPDRFNLDLLDGVSAYCRM